VTIDEVKHPIDCDPAAKLSEREPEVLVDWPKRRAKLNDGGSLRRTSMVVNATVQLVL
jgi:hypothetical protein